jgi:hypothetical protein
MNELNIAVARFLDEIQRMGVGTDGVGHQKNKYVTLPTLLGQATTAANAQGLSYQNVVGMDVGYMTVTHILIHKETGEVYALTYAGPPLGAPGTASPQTNQTWGASRTYTVRTTLMSFCGIHQDPDWDGDWLSPAERTKTTVTSNGKAPAQSNVNGKVVAAKSNGKVAAKPLTARESLHVAMKAAGLTDKGDMQEEFDSLILIFGGKPQSDADWAKFLAEFKTRQQAPATAA